MWTLFKKEWSENILYIAGAFILILLVVDYTAHMYYNWSFLGLSSSIFRNPDSNIYNQVYGTSNNPFPARNMPWTAICIVAGTLLGLRQIYSEHLRRTWALLAQLPIGREKIIFAKFLAGISILIVLFLPLFLLVAFRLSRPGVWPGPVYMAQFLPLPVALLSGLICYQVVLLFALSPQRWFGTRLLIIFAAIPALVLPSALDSGFRFSGTLYYRGDISIWIATGIVLIVAMLGFWSLHSVACSREY